MVRKALIILLTPVFLYSIIKLVQVGYPSRLAERITEGLIKYQEKVNNEDCVRKAPK